MSAMEHERGSKREREQTERRVKAGARREDESAAGPRAGARAGSRGTWLAGAACVRRGRGAVWEHRTVSARHGHVCRCIQVGEGAGGRPGGRGGGGGQHRERVGTEPTGGRGRVCPGRVQTQPADSAPGRGVPKPGRLLGPLLRFGPPPQTHPGPTAAPWCPARATAGAGLGAREEGLRHHGGNRSAPSAQPGGCRSLRGRREGAHAPCRRQGTATPTRAHPGVGSSRPRATCPPGTALSPTAAAVAVPTRPLHPPRGRHGRRAPLCPRPAPQPRARPRARAAPLPRPRPAWPRGAYRENVGTTL